MWGYDALGSPELSIGCQSLPQLGKGPTTTTTKLLGSRKASGLWEVTLPPRPAGTVCELQVTDGSEDIVLRDIMHGDIWLCSGQSNMEQSMANIMNATEEIAASTGFTSIRFTVVQNAVSADPDPDMDVPLQQPWADSSDSAALSGMSAVCFLFARSLQEEWAALGQPPVPLGLVDSDWGGTPLEAWAPPGSLDTCGAGGDCCGCSDDYPNHCPARLYNAMIGPLTRVALKGFLWYQGEANTNMNNNRDLYNCTFPALIDSWRQEFSADSATAPDAPFGFVQLASWRPDSLDAGFPVIRWHQTADMGYVPNARMEKVFMASPLDTYDSKEGYPGNIHTRYKQIVGERLALAGLHVAYGESAFRPYGPLPAEVTLQEEKQQITVRYDYSIVFDNTEISGFYACNLEPWRCDDMTSLTRWVEVNKEAVTQVDEKTLTISVEFSASKVFSLAYLWRETPVKSYLGLPVYGATHRSLPSPPWKKACLDTSCN